MGTYGQQEDSAMKHMRKGMETAGTCHRVQTATGLSVRSGMKRPDEARGGSRTFVTGPTAPCGLDQKRRNTVHVYTNTPMEPQMNPRALRAYSRPPYYR